MRLDERFREFRRLIELDVPDAHTAMMLLREYRLLVEATTEEIAKAWFQGNQVGFDRGWLDGYYKGYIDGQEGK